MVKIRAFPVVFLTALFLIGAAPLSYGNIALLSPGSVTVSGSEVKAEQDLSVAARQFNVVSVRDSSYDKLTNESKGFLSSYKQVDERRVSRAIGSHLKARNVRIDAGVMTMIGSGLEADSARITVRVLNLASDKNSETDRHFRDGSGLILRTISDKGHVKETAVASTIAAEKLIFNGRTLGGEAGHGEGDHRDRDRHHGDDHESLITALSSEHNLNEAQINQIRAVLNSKEWDKEITTLSRTGALIVQAVTTYFTAGAGSGVASALMEGMSEIAQAAVAAAIDSMAQQVTGQLLTAALTGEGLHLDVESIARNAVLSGLVAGVNFKMDAMIKQADLGMVGSGVARGVGHAVTTEAVYGGKFKDALKRSLVSEASAASFEFIGHKLKQANNRNLNLPEATVLHAMVGGTLAQISGGDFSTGAIATAASHVVAEQVKSHYLDQVISGEMSLAEVEGKVSAISRLVGGAAALAVRPDISPQALSAAQAEAASVARNNSLKLLVTAAKIGKRLAKIKGKLTSARVKKVLKDEGLDIAGDVYTFIDPEAGVADMAWALADLTLGTSFNNRAFAVAKRFGGKGKKADKEVFRQGTFADKGIGWDGNYVKGKQWATDNPLTTPGYSKKYGLPAENTGKPDWVVKGAVKGPYSTRPSPGSHNNPANTGGGTETIPRNPNDVELKWFHMPD